MTEAKDTLWSHHWPIQCARYLRIQKLVWSKKTISTVSWKRLTHLLCKKAFLQERVKKCQKALDSPSTLAFLAKKVTSSMILQVALVMLKCQVSCPRRRLHLNKTVIAQYFAVKAVASQSPMTSLWTKARVCISEFLLTSKVSTLIAKMASQQSRS